MVNNFQKIFFIILLIVVFVFIYKIFNCNTKYKDLKDIFKKSKEESLQLVNEIDELKNKETLCKLKYLNNIEKEGLDISSEGEDEESLLSSRYNKLDITLNAPNNNINNSNTLEQFYMKSKYQLGEKGSNQCNTDSVSKEKCLEAAKSLLPEGLEMGRKQLQIGNGDGKSKSSWGGVPPGCSVQSGGDWTAHYNEGSGINNGIYQTVCVSDDDEDIDGNYILGKAGETCDTESVSQDECMIAAKKLVKELGKQMGRKTLQIGDGTNAGIGSWGGVPPGCSVQSGGDWAAHYNTGQGHRTQSYTPICKGPSGAELLNNTNKLTESTKAPFNSPQDNMLMQPQNSVFEQGTVMPIQGNGYPQLQTGNSMNTGNGYPQPQTGNSMNTGNGYPQPQTGNSMNTGNGYPQPQTGNSMNTGNGYPQPQTGNSMNTGNGYRPSNCHPCPPKRSCPPCKSCPPKKTCKPCPKCPKNTHRKKNVTCPPCPNGRTCRPCPRVVCPPCPILKKIDIKHPVIKDSGMCLSKLNKNGYSGNCLSSEQRQVEDCKNKLIHGGTLSRKEIAILKKYGDSNDIAITSENYINTRKPIILSGEECNNYNSLNNVYNNYNNDGPNGEENIGNSDDLHDNLLTSGNYNNNSNMNDNNMNNSNMNNGNMNNSNMNNGNMNNSNMNNGNMNNGNMNNGNMNNGNMNNGNMNNGRRNDPNIIGNQNMVSPNMNNNYNNVEPRSNNTTNNSTHQEGVPSPQNVLGSRNNQSNGNQEEEEENEFNWKPNLNITQPWEKITKATTDFGSIKKGKELNWSLPANPRSQEACGQFCKAGGFKACSYRCDGCFGTDSLVPYKKDPCLSNGYGSTYIKSSAQPEEEEKSELQCRLDYCNAHGDLKNAYCGGKTCITKAQSDACGTHFTKYGRNEGRKPNPELCAGNEEEKKIQCRLEYCNAHGDLKNAYCGGKTCITKAHSDACGTHFTKYGKNEGRKPDPELCAGNEEVKCPEGYYKIDSYGSKISKDKLICCSRTDFKAPNVENCIVGWGDPNSVKSRMCSPEGALPTGENRYFGIPNWSIPACDNNNSSSKKTSRFRRMMNRLR